MPYETDERLKGFLDTNQLLREQLCAALLSVDPRFSNVRAQHPRGGPDGGADITATYKLTLDAIAAVGFVNQATDSPTHRRSASKKFASDLERSLSRSRVPDAFVFFTNVSLTNTQKVKLTDMGYSAGLSHCDIIDREQMRLRLDSSEGLAIRYQYLRIPMSEAEQALFFSKWGEKINQSISEGFSETTKLLNRVQFFHEATYGLRELSVLMELDREYPEEELGAVSAHARVLFPRRWAPSWEFSSAASNTSRASKKEKVCLCERASPSFTSIPRRPVRIPWTRRITTGTNSSVVSVGKAASCARPAPSAHSEYRRFLATPRARYCLETWIGRAASSMRTTG